MKKFITILIAVILLLSFSACESDYSTGSYQDKQNTVYAANKLQTAQPTPTDINYSLERYNLIRRAYWVNGQREKARTYPCPISDIPLGYVILLSDSGAVVCKFTVEGKVSSLNSYLTPDSEYPSYDSTANVWLADIDGSYGENDSGIFFFTPDGKYIEWSGKYLYSDIPFKINNPVVTYSETK